MRCLEASQPAETFPRRVAGLFAAALYGQELLGLPGRAFDRTQMGSLAVSA